MKEFSLKYGLNPNQKPARIFVQGGGELPLEVLNGRPGYINFLDALNSWQLVSELRQALGLPAAASFKHVSPTSAAVGLPLPLKLKMACFVEGVLGLDENPLACAYARARGTARLCSFGAWVAVRLMKRVGGPWPCILVSPPNGMFTFPSLRDDPVWIVTGGYDQFCSIPGLEGLIGKERITVVQGADHFWLGEERPLERYLDGRLGLLVDGMA